MLKKIRRAWRLANTRSEPIGLKDEDDDGTRFSLDGKTQICLSVTSTDCQAEGKTMDFKETTKTGNAAKATTIARINALIESLPQDAVIVWLAGDGSWGGLPGLGLYLPEQITEDMRDQYGIEEDAILVPDPQSEAQDRLS